MDNVLFWLRDTLLVWIACIAVSLPFVLLGMGNQRQELFRRYRLQLVLCSLFFLGCLLLFNLDAVWVFIRKPWQSMILEAAFALGVIVFTRSIHASGVKFSIDRQAWLDASIATALLILFVFARNVFLRSAGSIQGGDNPGFEFLLYQLTLPGIAEELVYRGVIQSRLDRIYPRMWKLGRANLGWGFIITAVLFWAVHAFRIENHSLAFYWQTLTLQLFAGLVFGWLRARTDSIIPGIIAHNLANVIWQVT